MDNRIYHPVPRFGFFISTKNENRKKQPHSTDQDLSAQAHLPPAKPTTLSSREEERAREQLISIKTAAAERLDVSSLLQTIDDQTDTLENNIAFLNELLNRPNIDVPLLLRLLAARFTAKCRSDASKNPYWQVEEAREIVLGFTVGNPKFTMNFEANEIRETYPFREGAKIELTTYYPDVKKRLNPSRIDAIAIESRPLYYLGSSPRYSSKDDSEQDYVFANSFLVEADRFCRHVSGTGLPISEIKSVFGWKGLGRSWESKGLHLSFKMVPAYYHRGEDMLSSGYVRLTVSKTLKEDKD